MVTFYEEIVPELHDFIIAQSMFFTASAPLHLPNSHVNCSPKGLADTTFTIVNPRCVWYQDSTGSGAETISHIYDNGRITIMFCSFGQEPKIIRLFGKGTVYEFGTKEFDELVPVEKRLPAARAVIRVDIHKTQKSCGYGVPVMQFVSERSKLSEWGSFITRESTKLDAYQDKNNTYSLDGLPGLKSSRERGKRSVFGDEVRRWARGVWQGKLDAVLLGWLIGVFIAILNEVVQRYGGVIKDTVVNGIHGAMGGKG